MLTRLSVRSRLTAHSSNADSSSAHLSSCQLLCCVRLSFFPTQLRSPGWTEATVKGRRRWQRQKGQLRRDLMRWNKWRGEGQWRRRRGSSLPTEKMTYVTPDTPTATDPPWCVHSHWRKSLLHLLLWDSRMCGDKTARHIYSIRTPQPESDGDESTFKFSSQNENSA